MYPTGEQVCAQPRSTTILGLGSNAKQSSPTPAVLMCACAHTPVHVLCITRTRVCSALRSASSSGVAPQWRDGRAPPASGHPWRKCWVCTRWASGKHWLTVIFRASTATQSMPEVVSHLSVLQYCSAGRGQVVSLLSSTLHIQLCSVLQNGISAALSQKVPKLSAGTGALWEGWGTHGCKLPVERASLAPGWAVCPCITEGLIASAYC